MSNRIACLVPFCRRTAPAEKYEGSEIICAKHWRAISRQTRAFKTQAERRHSKLLRRWDKAQPTGDILRARRLERLLDQTYSACNRAWELCRSEAIEAAAGIT